MISVRNLVKKFDDAIILNDISIDFPTGQISALVGQSGSGKSTFLHTVGLLDHFDSGSLFLDSQDCSNLKESKKSEIRRNKIGFIYQFHHLLPEFTVLENVIIPGMLLDNQKQDLHTSAKQILDSLDIKDDKLFKHPYELSGGEQQRVAIARSLINNPKILLADEPTGNLDSKNSDLVYNLIIDLSKEYKLTVVFVTHNTSLARKMDVTYTMQNGNILV